ncbi:restriction endonuclease subunit S [Yersinia rochesterensis]|uniref:restriction endonuclease subunit S n=1 Tax=Yersinia rochesterensis TaxID=1604335 RepID=UPI0016438E9C|nr:restriction endonuclease subunit S [Yersinia rochesterensis]
MGFEWRTVTLNEAGVTLIDCDHKTPKAVENGKPYIGIPQLKNGRVILEGARLISNEDFSHWRRKALPMPNDVILSRRCNPGETAYVPEGLNIALGQNLVLLRATNESVYPPFLRWLAQGPAWWVQVNNFINVGAVFDSLKCADIPKFLICLPPYQEQIKISEILRSLDEKIQINESVNQTLEQMAQALFKSWFVDFEPVKVKIAVLEAGGSQEEATLAAMTVISGKDADSLAFFEREYPEQYAELKATAELFPSAMQESELGEIPVGWKFSSLEDVTSLIIDHRGKTPKKLGGDWSEDGHPAISAKNIKNGRLVRHDAIRYVDSNLYAKWMKDTLLAGDILMTSEAPLGELMYLAKDCDYLLSQRLYGIRADKEIISGCYLYFWLQTSAAKADIDGRATGSTVVGIRQSELRKVNVMAPQKAVVESFSSLTTLYLAKIESNEKQNIVLEKLRDTLLPKLLSGEITLPEAEQSVSEAENV